MRNLLKRGLAGLALTLAALFGATAIAQPANAASYTKGVYAPYINGGGNVEAWANVNATCEDTWGCWTYVKIERLSTAPLVIKPWDYQGGQWASNGWNHVVVRYNGCSYYRMVVESYNDAASNSVAGINLGVVQASLGGGVKRYKKTEYSSSVRLCRYA